MKFFKQKLAKNINQIENIYGFFILCFILLFFYLTLPFFKTINEISNFNSTYYSILIKDSIPQYTSVSEVPPDWVPISKISKKLIGAIVVSEDGKFFIHHGYDIEQIQKIVALKYLEKKKKVRGASTITQQLIKNLYLTKEKSITRKLKELYFANYIEDKATKEKILETYLNIIEYGPGIYGIKSASKFYFNKDASKLNAKESAYLAMLLPSPVKYFKSFKQKRLTPFATSIIDSVLWKMKMDNYIGEEEYNLALSSKLSFETMDNKIVDDESEKDITLDE